MKVTPNAILIEPNNDADLKAALEWAFDHPKERKEMGARAKKHVEKFSLDTMISRTATVLQEVVNEPVVPKKPWWKIL